MSGAKLLPCAHCGIELYACTEGWSGGTRYAHEANSCILSRKFVQGPEQEEAWNRRAAASVVGEPVAWIPQSRWERMTAAEPWLTNIVYSEDQSKFFSCVPLYAAPSAPDGWQPDVSQQWFLDRIGEEITAGRKQNALTYLSCAFAEISHRQDELRRLGAQMSNVLYNLAQTADLSVANREMMKELASQWDAAVSATLKEAETQS